MPAVFKDATETPCEATLLEIKLAILQIGIDIIIPFLLAMRQLKYLVVNIEYLVKWIEVEPLATIGIEKF